VEFCRELNEQGADWATFWRELVLAFRDRLEAEARSPRGPHELLRWARMLHLLLGRERDLRDSSLPRVVVELALITAAQLPHLAPLDALISGGATTGAPSRPQGPPPVPPSPRSAPPGPQAAPPGPRSAPQVAPAPEGPRRPAPVPVVSPSASAKPAKDHAPGSPAQLRAACSEALRQAPGLRALATAPQLASELRWESPVLRFSFPANVRQTLQDFEREKASPHLLAALAAVLPGLQAVEVRFDDAATAAAPERPEDRLRQEPAFQELLRMSGGEVVEIRRES
jgi:hypothetical protein